ncbi:MAG: FAD-dependent monooxygenase [Microbacteriaceae bacterium]
MPDLKIAVIGAGVGGLVAAIALQNRGHRVQIFERSAVPRTSGSGISLFGNALKALAAVELGDLLAEGDMEHARMSEAGQRKPDGSWLMKLPANSTKNLTVLPRTELHKRLIRRLKPGTLVLGTEALVESSENGILMLSRAGQEPANEQYDLIIAADGLRSGSRKALGIDPGLRYAGYTAWRGMTVGDNDYGDIGGATWGRGEHFGYSPMLGGGSYWFATATVPEHHQVRGNRIELMRRFKRWHEPIRQIIEDTPENNLIRHDIYALRKPLKRFTSGRVLLLGDAAHGMTPDLGQGACQAIEDAATIANLIGPSSNSINTNLALRRYDKLRRGYTTRVSRRSWLVGKMGQNPSPVFVRFRDVGMRLFPQKLFALMMRNLHSFQKPKSVGKAS